MLSMSAVATRTHHGSIFIVYFFRATIVHKTRNSVYRSHLTFEIMTTDASNKKADHHSPSIDY